MFGKVQQAGELLKMRQQAMALQKKLAEITETVEDDGMIVKVSGDQRVLFLSIDGEENKKLAELINKAMKEVQKKSAKKMMEDGGGLSGLLGGLGGK